MVNRIHLPISKSIAQRMLLLQAIHGDPLMRVSSDMPEDVRIMHDALEQIQAAFGPPRIDFESKEDTPRLANRSAETDRTSITVNLHNCGTALRFLQVYLQRCYPDKPIVLTGDSRLMERNGKPTSQTTSARILLGDDIPVSTDESPYITMSRRLVALYPGLSERGEQGSGLAIERDWSAAAFWYEYIAIHGGEMLLQGLSSDSLQGDRIVADIYAKYFNVQTSFSPEGTVIHCAAPLSLSDGGKTENSISIDFSRTPDLYPAIALTCERLGIALIATGTERLKYKESDRLEAVRLHEVRNDHRMAMALLAADYLSLQPNSPQEKEIRRIVAKSYPDFLLQFFAMKGQKHDNCATAPFRHRDNNENGNGFHIENITPIKGVNDDNRGKKHALSKLIHASQAEYVWLHDDDVILPSAAQLSFISLPIEDGVGRTMDMYILPLCMESEKTNPSLLERLQIAEYAAIQQLTIESAQKNKPVMCSGANLIVRRDAWLACEPDLHLEIPSGDDMFLLEAMKRKGYEIAVLDKPDFTAVIRPLTSWSAFFRQRTRWAGKAPHFKDHDIRRCGMIVAMANILQILCPLVLLIKFPVEYRLIKRRFNHEPQNQTISFGVIVLLELFYPFYMLICLLGGLLHPTRW